MTCVKFHHRTSPPWNGGNCFHVAPESSWVEVEPEVGTPDPSAPHWLVLNMHAENFLAIVAQERLESLEIESIDDRHCLIVDPRIPQGWLRSEPCQACVAGGIASMARGLHAGAFRPVAEVPKADLGPSSA
jgi:hypothetical protein